MIKGTDEQSDEEVHRARFRRVQHRSVSPCGVEVQTLQAWMCSPTKKLSEPCTVGIFMEE